MVSFFLFFPYLCCFYILTVYHSVFLSLSFSLPVSPFTSLPLRFVFIRRVYYRFVCRLLAVRFLWSLPAPTSPPFPFLRLLPLTSSSFFSSGLPPIHFLVSFLLLSLLLLPWFSLSFSFSCLFSLLGNSALQCCLSLLVHLRL